MKIVESNIEARLVDFANDTRGSDNDYYVIHFRFSKLTELYKSDFQIKIALNILNDLFREEKGVIMKLENLDLFLLYEGEDKNLLSKAIFQLRYLFFDDPLATLPNGNENKEFAEVYDLNFQWSAYSKLANQIMSESIQKSFIDEGEIVENKFDLKSFVNIEKTIDEERLDSCIRRQPICSIKNSNSSEAKSLFHEIYMNISSLQQKLKLNFNLAQEKWLFYHLTKQLDEKVLEIVSLNPENFLYMPVSLNLNLSTITSPDFTEFCEIAKDFKSQIVIEISVTDVFSNIYEFHKASDLSHKRNHKICIDGLNNDSFVQVSRRSLGFDLAKLQWNADMKSDLNLKQENEKLKQVVNECGSNRLILCRCDDVHAIDYGHELGISLFQGRYPDRIINPNNKLVN